MSEADDRPWGAGEPPHGWVCMHCGKSFTTPGGCERAAYGLHFRSMELTARWHRTIEEIAAVSEENARREDRGKFIVKLDLNKGLFAGDFRDRDAQIANALYEIADRMISGQYTADDTNRMRFGSFKFKEEA